MAQLRLLHVNCITSLTEVPGLNLAAGSGSICSVVLAMGGVARGLSKGADKALSLGGRTAYAGNTVGHAG